ncbi:MAG: efflux RND transporter permease subunit [Spirochaetes bacterium]|nr:efflux RND transporter permease subunit [Spirochaetota bacterium]
MIQYFIKRYVASFLIVGILVILGIFAINTLPVSFYPDFSVPSLFINTLYPGAGPESIEEEVTKVIEEAVSTISGIDEISSSSQEGFSLVQVSFSFGVDLEEKSQDVQKKIDQIKSQLPREAEIPSIIRINDFLAPPIELAVTSTRRTLGDLKLYVDNRLGPAFSRLPGVATVKVTGGSEQIVEIKINPLRLRETSLSFNQIANSIQSANLNLPIGEIKGETNSFTVRIDGKYQSLTDIQNVFIPTVNDQLIRLADIAEINLIEKKQYRFSRINQTPAIGVIVRKPSGGNSVEVANQVKQWIKDEGDKIPSDIKIQIVSDESLFIQGAINNVFVSLLLGAVLASLIIFLFLGNIRNTLVIILSIPATLIISFIFMKLFNLSLNTVSLGGMGMAVGMIVDSAIVVMENIVRHLEARDFPGNRSEIIARSTTEVALAISASVFTTIVVFLPLAFTRGLAKVLLGELSLVIVFALFISIIIAVIFVPILSYFLIKIDFKRNRLSKGFLKIMEALKKGYLLVLQISLRHKAITFFIFLIIMIGAFFIGSSLNTGLFPESDQGQFQVVLTYPRGTAVEYTNQQVREFEEKLLKLESIELVSSVIGEDIFFNTILPYSATLNILTDRQQPTAEVIQEVRTLLKQFPGVDSLVRIIDASAGFNSRDVDLTIVGDDLEILQNLSNELMSQLAQVDGLVNIQSDLQKGLPSYFFVPDRRKMVEMGTSLLEVADTIRTGKTGLKVTRFAREEYDIDVEISLANSEEYLIKDIRNMPILTRRGGIVPLYALGTFQEGFAPSEINHISLRRTVNITGDFSDKKAANQLKKAISQKIESFNLPEGYFFDQARSSRAIIESFKTLGIALLIAIILVYVIMGVQFNSFGLPLLIAFSIPFSFPGALLLMYATDTILNLPSFLGLIMLSGIVVNNGIIFLDFVINFSQKYQTVGEAIQAAGEIRFRPIVMTTLTTIFGMFFLAINIGGGGEALRPLAITVIGGLAYGLLVSLIFIPMMYALFHKNKAKK